MVKLLTMAKKNGFSAENYNWKKLPKDLKVRTQNNKIKISQPSLIMRIHVEHHKHNKKGTIQIA